VKITQRPGKSAGLDVLTRVDFASAQYNAALKLYTNLAAPSGAKFLLARFRVSNLVPSIKGVRWLITPAGSG